jgi:hypothetical protein
MVTTGKAQMPRGLKGEKRPSRLRCTFEGWVRFQGYDVEIASPEVLDFLRSAFDDRKKSATGKVGLMKLGPVPMGEHRFAVAIRKKSELWLTLWVRYRPRVGSSYLCRAPIEVGIPT